ncbi:lipid-A-disaccharide synthase [Flaviflagellibacter deserti]|uniref:Lipid-A-disaccharide synthase n=1 Tax=Flaviflagellibacter deserti TaxID=2267266 RepID=A0ABV9Z4N5_9HYPH
MTRPLSIFIVTGEHSGDQLGAALMRSLRTLAGADTVFRGVGGHRMAEQGLSSLFPLEDIAVMGFGPVIQRLPLLLRRIRETADAIIADQPDVLVIIDSPDFTHRVARKVRAAIPRLPIIDYVSPTVWAWRPGRAKKMTAYVDHVLALLPFEPEVHRRLGGPACTYVGHPLIEKLDVLQPKQGERADISEGVHLILLPGSRRSVVQRHLSLFRDVSERLPDTATIVLPTTPRLAGEIEELTAGWKRRPRVVTDEAEKWAAFRRANVALASSGTVTLELALSGVPMIGIYALEPLARLLKSILPITAPHILLPNLILGSRVIPELVGPEITVQSVADALKPLMTDTPERRAQMEALGRMEEIMIVAEPPSVGAARVVLDLAGTPR